MANRFWVGQPISSIQDNGSGKARCIVTSTTGMTSTETRNFAGVTGTPLLNGDQVITVVNSTAVDVTAVSFVATGTGAIHGRWDTNNLNNWVTTTNGTNYGQTVPGASDTVTFDANSSGGNSPTIVVGSISANIQSLTCQTYAGTIDFAINAPTMYINTVTGVSFGGAGVKTINLGASNWTMVQGSFDLNNGNNTVTATTASFTFTYPNAFFSTQFFNPGPVSTVFGNSSITLSSPRSVGAPFTISQNLSVNNFSISNTAQVLLNVSGTLTTNNMTVNGLSTYPCEIGVHGATASTTTLSITTSLVMNYVNVRNITFTGAGTKSITGWDMGGNSNATITLPSLGGGRGWLTG